MGYICSYCGYKSSSGSGGSCNHSPSKTHIYINESSSGYICCFCGLVSSQAAGNHCNKSPHKNHEYI
ncbi:MULTISPECIES: hypothetical protein [unclassified Campylobacter]|uniref:hypothetical protein n=1 Tax=unclassified Campylobacter TaxID=2593542 RepID=UPI001BD9BE80|nr:MULTISPECIES: hypothetical protein [unclassified Campylobacter]MBT0879779.1 hypothetical protein [Campylobacter sp. 2018MI27]MBT0885111.1 hypothetical protein [Campylobacter sp. 2018MI10]